jgi:hypothetical protein
MPLWKLSLVREKYCAEGDSYRIAGEAGRAARGSKYCSGRRMIEPE